MSGKDVTTSPKNFKASPSVRGLTPGGTINKISVRSPGSKYKF